jgi:hypothetical protein
MEANSAAPQEVKTVIVSPMGKEKPMNEAQCKWVFAAILVVCITITGINISKDATDIMLAKITRGQP